MVLVTGATGILGRVIVLELLKRGRKVRATKRNTSNTEEVKQSYGFYTDNPDFYFNQIEWVNVDFADVSSLQDTLEGVVEVYHCAAAVSFHPGSANNMFRTNIHGTRNLLYACTGSSVKKFCFISSTAVLDGFNERGEADEDSNYNPKLDHSAYAISKHFSEMEVWRASAEGLATVIVNPGVIIGSGNWDESSGLLFKNLSRGYTFSGGTSYVDVRDVAEISIQLMDENVFAERYILVSENKRYQEVAGAVRAKMGLRLPKVLPASALYVGRILNLFLGWLFPVLRMANKLNTDTVSSFHTVSNKKIKEKLNFVFIPVADSIDFHLSNYISDRKIK